jgi:hypothetical protein
MKKSLFTHKGVAIYAILRHDHPQDIVRTYWYGWSPKCNDAGRDSFDIRDVEGYDGPTGVFQVGVPLPARETRAFDPIAFMKKAIDDHRLQAHIKKLRGARRRTTASRTRIAARRFLVEARFSCGDDCYATERYELAAPDEDSARVRAGHVARASMYADPRIDYVLKVDVLREVPADSEEAT